MGTMFTKQSGSHTLVKLSSLCRRAVTPMEFCLAKRTISIFCRSRAVCSITTPWLVLFFRAALLCQFSVSGLGQGSGVRTQLDLRFVASQPKASGEQGNVAHQSVGWNCRRNPGTWDTTSDCDSFGKKSVSFRRLGSSSASIVSSYVALIAIVLTSCRKYTEIDTKF